ncbi:hypothetical protein DIPPA_17289 [Diplonema papillatum]|nr:hypothetical protein DIPPA_17289 [Diplonema papillatum]
MPLLWGLLSLPTVSEVGALAVLGKVCGGDVGGIPAPYYAADWLVSGLAFLRLPTDRELQQAAIKDVKKARQSALSQDFVGHGYLFSFPFHTGLAVLTNAIVAALLLCGLRLVWTWGVRGRDEPGELSLHASPADAAALVLFVAAIVLLLGLHNTCYSTQESAGLSAVYASMAASIGVLGVVISEEIPSLNFELHSTAVILNEHWKQKLTSGAPVPIIAALWRIATPSPFVLTFITAVTCVAATYGLSSATWRLVRCHYQLSDRAGNALAEVEKKRQQDLLNYKLARLNKNMQNNPFLNQAPEAGGPQADGSAAEQPPLDGSLAGCAGYYRTFGLKLLSWLTIAAPVAVAASFVHAASGASPEVVCWRQLCCAALVASRLALAKTYLQTFLLRDSNEALKRSDSKNFASKVLSEKQHTVV